MAQPVIIEAVRTPIGKRNGWLSGVKAPALLAHAQFALLERTGIDAASVDQLIGEPGAGLLMPALVPWHLRTWRWRNCACLRHDRASGHPSSRVPGHGPRQPRWYAA